MEELKDIYIQLVEENENLDSGKTLDEIYHEANEKYISGITSEMDYLMMQWQEGLI